MLCVPFPSTELLLRRVTLMTSVLMPCTKINNDHSGGQRQLCSLKVCALLIGHPLSGSSRGLVRVTVPWRLTVHVRNPMCVWCKE